MVYLVDDDVSFAAATARLLKASGYQVRSFATAREFLEQRETGVPGCVVVDLKMPEMDGLELQTTLARTRHPLPVIFLTGHGDIRSSVRAMRDGAEDFLEKRAAKEELLSAVQRALDRGTRDREALVRKRGLQSQFGSLSERELEVLGHVVQGKLNKQIASELGIHERTVKLHRTAITTKLGVRSVAELTRLTHEAGLFHTFPKGQ